MWRRRNIMIEQVTKEELERLDVIALRDLRSRFINVFDKFFVKYNLQKAAGMLQVEFMAKYNLLRKELNRRGDSPSQEQPIDQELGKILLKSVMWGLDISMLNDMLVMPDYVSISGDFINSPTKTSKIEVVIKNKEENRSEKFEGWISQLIKNQTRKEPVFIYTPDGPDSSYIPIFDLILKAHGEIAKVAVEKEVEKKTFLVKKPEENGTIRIPVGPDCEVTATISIDKGQGISALYCGKVKKIRTYLFDKKKKAWTMVSARAWIKEHHNKALQKKLSEAKQKDYELETEKIRQNRENAKYPHKFNPAKWTHPNGHPRCLTCGQEQRESEVCSKPITKFKIMKIDAKQQVIGGIVYEPDVVDTQGDYTDEKEIEKAMYRFMEKYATDTKRARINHEGKRYFFPILECFQPDEDTVKGDKPLKKGSWWLMMKVTNKDIWDKIESGELEAFSMGGVARG